MSVEADLAELIERHRVLDATIDEELARPHADDIRVADLKKRKLAIKDQIERIRAANAALH